MENNVRITALYSRVRELLDSARANVARSVNSTQVVANWLIGREIVEEQQRGRKRASYGKQVVELGKGFAFVARQQRLTINGDHLREEIRREVRRMPASKPPRTTRRKSKQP